MGYTEYKASVKTRVLNLWKWLAILMLVTMAGAGTGLATPPTTCTLPLTLGAQAPPALSKLAAGNDCDFHQLAWQNFLNLLMDDQANIKKWPASHLVYPDKGGTPNCSPNAAQGALGYGVDHYNLKFNDHEDIPGVPLVDQKGNYVFYEVRLNKVLCGSINKNSLYKMECVDQYTEGKNNNNNSKKKKKKKSFPGFPPTAASEPVSAEAKLAWRVLKSGNTSYLANGNTLSDFVTATITVGGAGANAFQQGPSRTLTSSTTLTLGLVGFHYMIKTYNQPDWIWATWEHVTLAPVCEGTNTTCEDPSPSYTQNAQLWNGRDCPANPYTAWSSKEQVPPGCSNYPYQTAFTSAQVCRVYPCGCGSTVVPPGTKPLSCNTKKKTVNNINELNASVRAKLGALTSGDKVLKNYFLVGTVWGPPRKVPHVGMGSDNLKTIENSAGSIFLLNTTMETFVQTTVGNVGNAKLIGTPANCFTCHKVQGAGGKGFQNLDYVHSLVRARNFGSCTPSTKHGAP